MSVLSCQKPDVDSPKLVCGHPLPCPHHTVIIDVPRQQIAIPVSPNSRFVIFDRFPGKLADILGALTPRSE